MEPNIISKPLDNCAIVLFDGSCPLCSREIAHYQRRKNSNQFIWIDASKDLDELQSLGIRRDDALSIFHVRTADGTWRTGVGGFLYIWSRLPAYQWLSRIIHTLKITPLLEQCYRVFLKYRHSRTSSQTQNIQPR